MTKSADHTELLKIVKFEVNCKELQRDFTKLGQWANEIQC